ncbi:GNAT family N-acetyltransferase [Pseudoroseicyclus tamaricis]|uniref:GNAT family N-acetyltransferase n=1 Tax=Pseudoroseicyclus tamaricis TaxID=2705421 RepID=A0A6B2JKR7_9RHOB|nr:GNAT family N-acetyltransferase [Pseudoroseicyclus tamaricis]NDV02101.1 GNAT family N-acetyltransferase [Pseudoroseicyclus tamaricis]
MRLERGFAEAERAEVARLYWQAFGPKLGRALNPEAKALAFLASVLRPDHALVVRGADGRILGAAGFKTHEGALAEGGLTEMAHTYGWAGGLARLSLLALMERDRDNHRFLVDGIFVEEAARGGGAGTLLIRGLAAEARWRGYRELRLDVIARNARAQALYERCGFRVIHRQRKGVGGRVFGYGEVLVMVLAL